MTGETRRRMSTKVAGTPPARQADGQPRLLSGGNPQIAKADGDAPVQAYIAAMRAGRARLADVWTSLSCRQCPMFARPSCGTRLGMASKVKVGS